MQIVLNPKYHQLHDELLQVVRNFESSGKEIYHGRNVIRLVEIDGLRLAVKRYGRMPLKHRVATRFYKTNKAKRAFVTSLMLKERSFESPEAVAFLCDRHSVLDATHYYVSIYSDYRHSMRDIPTLDGAFREEVTKSFARFAAQLHNSGFLHKDFSAGNILFDRINERFHFSLLDTNTLKWGKKISVERGCKNLGRLVGPPEFFESLGRHYADHRQADPQQCINLIKAARDDYRSRPHPHHQPLFD